MRYTAEELAEAQEFALETAAKCEKAQVKFAEGTPQYSLLKNRIRALYVSAALIAGGDSLLYSDDDLERALPPVTSIIHKCEKGQIKFEEGTVSFNRFEKMIRVMYIAKAFIEDALLQRE